jgi:hypothetical protein
MSASPPSVEVESLFDGRALSLTMLSSTRDAVDDFARLLWEDGQQRSRDGQKILYYLYDFSRTLSGLNTPYGRGKMNEMKNWKLSERVCVAVVLPDTVLMQISRFLVNSLTREDSAIRLTVSHAEALDWLQTMLTKEASGR